jgi:hypothetical protein
MERNKLLMFDKGEEAFNFHSQVDFECLLHTIATTINTYMNIMSRELLGF